MVSEYYYIATSSVYSHYNTIELLYIELLYSRWWFSNLD